MSRMSELHDDLTSIHQILLGQRKVATDTSFDLKIRGCNKEAALVDARIECINDLLLEFEAAGVVWPSDASDERLPDNVVELPVDEYKGRVYYGDIS